MPKIIQIQVVPGNARETDRLYALDDGGRTLIYDPTIKSEFKWYELVNPYTQSGFEMVRFN